MCAMEKNLRKGQQPRYELELWFTNTPTIRLEKTVFQGVPGRDKIVAETGTRHAQLKWTDTQSCPHGGVRGMCLFFLDQFESFYSIIDQTSKDNLPYFQSEAYTPSGTFYNAIKGARSWLERVFGKSDFLGPLLAKKESQDQETALFRIAPLKINELRLRVFVDHTELISPDELGELARSIEQDLVYNPRPTLDTKDNQAELDEYVDHSASLERFRSTVTPRPCDLLPGPPEFFYGRVPLLNHVINRLISESTQPSPSESLVLLGSPGAGKSTLLRAICHTPEIHAHFTDGILWSAIKPDSPVNEQVLRWASKLNINQKNPEEAGDQLRQHLYNKKCLLVLDNTDHLPDLRKLTLGGPNCATLIATRFPSTADGITSRTQQIIPVQELDIDSTWTMLQGLSQVDLSDYKESLDQLLSIIGRSPIAVRILASLIRAESRRGLPINQALEELLQDSKRIIDQQTPIDVAEDYPPYQHTLAAVFQRTLRYLTDAGKQHFAMLCAFAPAPASFSYEAIDYVWQSKNTRNYLREILDLGLLNCVDNSEYQIHALTHAYCSYYFNENWHALRPESLQIPEGMELEYKNSINSPHAVHAYFYTMPQFKTYDIDKADLIAEGSLFREPINDDQFHYAIHWIMDHLESDLYARHLALSIAQYFTKYISTFTNPNNDVLNWISTGIRISNQNNQKDILADMLNARGEFYLRKSELELSEESFSQALQVSQATNDDKNTKTALSGLKRIRAITAPTDKA